MRAGMQGGMAASRDRKDWQRRYDESLARERANRFDDDLTVGDVAWVGLTGCLGWWLVAAVLAVAEAVILIGRRFRRR
jgi:hypothetical protein